MGFDVSDIRNPSSHFPEPEFSPPVRSCQRNGGYTFHHMRCTLIVLQSGRRGASFAITRNERGLQGDIIENNLHWEASGHPGLVGIIRQRREGHQGLGAVLW